jgi:undecaprenyl-diphosphatase
MNLNLIQIIFLALLQGVTELFPISSLGHTVILPALFGWGDLVRDQSFLPLVVALHLGTSIALFVYFWKDWKQVLYTLYKSIERGEVSKDSQEWSSWLLIIGTIPAGIIGVFLESFIKNLFASPVIASGFLFVNGFILILGEIIIQRRKKTSSETKTRKISSLKWQEAVYIGLAQSLALIPGISRSGSTIVAGLMIKLDHEDAARFSFLMGTPVIAGAALLEIPQLFGLGTGTLLMILFGSFVSGLAAWFSTKFLLRYFEKGTLKPFAIYCWVAGLISFLIFLVR